MVNCGTAFVVNEVKGTSFTCSMRKTQADNHLASLLRCFLELLVTYLVVDIPSKTFPVIREC